MYPAGGRFHCALPLWDIYLHRSIRGDRSAFINNAQQGGLRCILWEAIPVRIQSCRKYCNQCECRSNHRYHEEASPAALFVFPCHYYYSWRIIDVEPVMSPNETSSIRRIITPQTKLFSKKSTTQHTHTHMHAGAHATTLLLLFIITLHGPHQHHHTYRYISRRYFTSSFSVHSAQYLL